MKLRHCERSEATQWAGTDLNGFNARLLWRFTPRKGLRAGWRFSERVWIPAFAGNAVEKKKVRPSPNPLPQGEG